MKIIDILERRSAPLYHATAKNNALSILETNTIIAKTHNKVNGKELLGISLTRSRDFAKFWSQIVFELDQAKLTTNYRIVPHDFWGFSGEPTLQDSSRRRDKFAEAEEFLIGSINNLDRYLTGVYFAQEWMLDEVDGISAYIRQYPLFKGVLGEIHVNGSGQSISA